MSVHGRPSLCLPNSLDDKPALEPWQRPRRGGEGRGGGAAEGGQGPLPGKHRAGRVGDTACSLPDAKASSEYSEPESSRW